ncbi:TPA: hypothetical protein F3L15_01145 [Aeromonas hydrophila]|uniref:hypothetical protein n=1 Tax=Aeromonas hydrophila TaxID=644 RepID=UPI0009BB2F4E|nr:hypothetical protein [Aeromonas hydrophila]HAU4882647.1 hypothetical protein [Aeromonas hydrophila]
MSNDELPENFENKEIAEIRQELDRLNPNFRRRALEKFALAALGSIPWVGGFISAAVNIKTEEGTLKTDTLQTRWLEEHQRKMEDLGNTLNKISERFDAFGESIEDRIRSSEYLDVVRKAFRAWDKSDTDEKRKYVSNLVSNAAGTHLCSDDVIRLFIDWLDLYHEAHFAVIRCIYQSPGVTRANIWEDIHGDFPREDSAEADLYRYLIRDLSMGGVIRQARETTTDGHFLKKRAVVHRKPVSSTTMESAFEDTKPYVLTELGKQFVHYTMNEVVERVN